MLSARAYAHRAAPDRGGCKSTRLGGGRLLPGDAGWKLSISKFSPIFPDLAVKRTHQALFAAGSALRFTFLKPLAATLPQMTFRLYPHGHNPLEVTK
ncbi:hypothetical protein EBB79_02210 [Parasedimentitalea marina]|uniref:Uncharacterized protein n=1 Tax=Parasedimentitalea marina TaxID=2483033 RepID=A0A3T0MYI7_9RHOB|nr:hypothetical protein EBB79_02210 [Parasedimentitalea marina]